MYLSVLGTGPTAVNKPTSPCPHGASVLERETEPSNVVTPPPGTSQVSPPRCLGARSGLQAPGAASLACLQLLSPQHSPHSWVSFSGAPPCKGFPLCMSLGTVPAPGFVSTGYHLGAEVIPIWEKRTEAESCHSCPQALHCRGPPRLPSHLCAEGPFSWHHAGHSQGAKEGEARGPTSPVTGHGPAATIQNLPTLQVALPSVVIEIAATAMCLLGAKASQQPSREASLPFYRREEQGPALFSHLPKVTASLPQVQSGFKTAPSKCCLRLSPAPSCPLVAPVCHCVLSSC